MYSRMQYVKDNFSFDDWYVHKFSVQHIVPVSWSSLIGAESLHGTNFAWYELVRQNKLDSNLKRKTISFIQETVFGNNVCEMVVIWFRPQYVNWKKAQLFNRTHSPRFLNKKYPYQQNSNYIPYSR